MNLSREHSSPAIFFFLGLPYGISSGFGMVTLPFVLTQNGFTVADAAAVTALGLSANVWRFFWAPLSEISLTLHKWYLIGIALCVASFIAMGLVPLASTPHWIISLVVFVSQVAGTFVVLPLGGFMAKTVVPNKKGRAAGWFQAGNLGGSIGGGAGIWIYSHYSFLSSVSAMAIVMLACSPALLFVPKVRDFRESSLMKSISLMARDVAGLFRSRSGLFAMAVVLAPIGTGAAAYVWSSIAGDWKVGADTTALTTGVLSGFASVLGCLAGGWLCDRFGHWKEFFWAGLLMAATTLYMALAPAEPVHFITGVLLYAFTYGMANAGFSTIILHAIGEGAASTKYALLSSMGNIPPVLVTMLDGWSHDHLGLANMLLAETILGVFFVAVAALALKKLLPAKDPAAVLGGS